MDVKSIEGMLPEQDLLDQAGFPFQPTYWEKLK